MKVWPRPTLIELWAPTPDEPWALVGVVPNIFQVPRQFDQVSYYNPNHGEFVNASVIRVVWGFKDLDHPIVQVYLSE